MPARDRVEQNDGVRPKGDHCERGTGRPHLARGPPHHQNGAHARDDRDHAVRVHLSDRRGEPPSEHTRQRAEQGSVDGGGVDPLRAEEMPERIVRVGERRVDVWVAVIDADDPPVEGIGVDVPREQQWKPEQYDVIARNQQQHGTEGDVSPPGLKQQEQERRDREHGDEHAGRHQRVAGQAVEEQLTPDPDERSIGGKPLGQHRLERRARRGGEYCEREDSDGGHDHHSGGGSGVVECPHGI
jgi:hypothetical protein